MDFAPRQAEVLFDGRLVRILFTTDSAPLPAENPDWRPAWLSGVRATLNGKPLRPLGVMVHDWTVTADQCWPEENPGAQLDGSFLARVSYVDDKGREVEQSAPYADFRSNQYSTSLAPGQGMTIRLPYPVPKGQHARVYLTNNEASHKSFRRVADRLPPGTELHTVLKPASSNAPGPDPLTSWILHAVLDDGPITLGAEARIELPAGLLKDDAGRTTAPASFPVMNRSLVGPDGFTDPSLGINKLAVHVSSKHGSDEGPGTPDRPVKSLRQAFSLLRNAGPGPATIRLLRGDRFSEPPSPPHWRKGQSDRLVIEDYWHDGFGKDPRTRPHFVCANDKAFLGWNGSHSEFLGPIFVRRIHVSGGRFSLVTAARAVVLDDCLLENATVSFQARGKFTTQEIVLLRSTLIDAARNEGRVQGFFCYGVRRVTISQCVVDRCGYSRADFSTRNAFSHSIYLQNSTGEAALWGNWITRGGSHGVQVRTCGLVAENIFARNPIGSFIKTGGTQSRNIYVNSDDIMPNIRRGFGATIGASPVPCHCQRIEGCLFLHVVGGQPRSMQCSELVDPDDRSSGFQEMRHNFVLEHGPAVYLFELGRRCVIRANVFNGSAGRGVYLVKSRRPDDLDTLEADLNVYHVSPDGIFLDKGPIATREDWIHSGRDQHSEFLKTPTSASQYGLGDYAKANNLGANEAAIIAALRNRAAGEWPEWISVTRAYDAFLKAYAPNIRAPFAAGPWTLLST